VAHSWVRVPAHPLKNKKSKGETKMREYKLSTSRENSYMIWVVNVAGVVCTTYMKSGLPQRNTLLTGAGNNIAKAKIAQLSV
jgi:hypothetical protein